MIIYMAVESAAILIPHGKIAKEAYAEPVLPRPAKHMIGGRYEAGTWRAFKAQRWVIR